MRKSMKGLWLNSSVSRLKDRPADQNGRSSSGPLDSVGAALRSVIDWFMEY